MFSIFIFFLNIFLFNMLFVSNPIYVIFNFIGVILTTCFFLFSTGCELFALFIILVYIGAIAVLFLFILLSFSMINKRSRKIFFIISNVIFITWGTLSIWYNLIKILISTTIIYNVQPNLIKMYITSNELASFGSLFYNTMSINIIIFAIILLIILYGIIIYTKTE